ncbi:PRP46 (YPL151C) [Zygosaccharomyces parabailii]|uniref:Pre-mRNA-splicing factor PRP46 n=1 Tax=Zygosaccharomyces bailii (strain CLIB 213 / ATCC 58445 / CBS 680 / BCRC 21525 / NBRC 1098 / NCYC 1416 / NRRL Y-2227) TaxID=1333698 RepID=A0A8J2TBK7_ZYGB2|nr:PRP46 (YPL151C) [Zygosaccharomyces parabailii]CDF91049.1 ZYBA0S09-03664g1_1 [Zygosaccharomyces bailii CLIB 213]CDH14073.1 probable Pre-mRNA-splicing factor PRP46 [Zygosaccharomyces bailii ISA1307]
MDEADALEDIDAFYASVRWNNQFAQLAHLPQHLQTVFDNGKTVLEKYEGIVDKNSKRSRNSSQLLKLDDNRQNLITQVYNPESVGHSVLQRQEQLLSQKPQWHPPWKLIRVINGHSGWVRCVQVDPVDNDWFATGSNDTTIKIWDLASGKLKLTLAGHVMTVRDVAISSRHPYLFSASEDKLVKCWDLEKNRSIRDYHGHLSGVHTVDVHPSLDLIATAGRDSVVKLWDIRSRVPVMTLVGHKSPINKIYCLPVDPQVVSASTDATIRLWDIVAGKTIKTLTHHKRSVRDLALHPTEFSMASACTDDIRSWKLPEGALLTNFASEDTGIINTLSINQDDVLFAGGDDGTLSFYDYKSGHKYQSMASQEVPGSLESERAILSSTFDQTGLRIITGETDKSIKMWKQISDATVHNQPGLPWVPTLGAQRF